MVTPRLLNTADARGIDPRWYGAAVDGVTDDTIALNAARAAARAARVPLLLPTGTIRYTSTLVIDEDDETIIGSGIYTEHGSAIGTRLLFDGAGPGILIGQDVGAAITFTYRTRLEGFSLKTPTTCTHGIRAWCPGMLRIRDLAVNGPLGNTNHCILVEQGVDVDIASVHVTGDNETYAADRTTYANGVTVATAMGSPSTTVSLRGVNARRCYEGIVVDGSYAVVERATIEGGWRGMRLANAAKVTMRSAWVEGCGYAANVAAFGYLSSGTELSLDGCTLIAYATPEFAFNVVGTARLIITGGDYAMDHATPALVSSSDYTYATGYVSVTDANLGTLAYGISYLSGAGVADRARRYVCSGTPEGAINANVGDVCLRTDGGSGTVLYVKESGTGNTGWVAMATGSGGITWPQAMALGLGV